MANSSQPSFLPANTASSVAWLFPGQGAQEVGMGLDLYEASAPARQVFDTADRVLGYKLTQVCFEGPEETLRQTEYTQPAIFATSLACLAAAVESGYCRERPAFMAGHSLGEYSALVAAGALSLEDGFVLLQERARLMAEAGRNNPGTMAAILGLDEAAVRAICADADVDICNMNQSTQIVIGGRREAIEAAMALAKERGGRATELNVSGAFHSRLMTPAVAGLEAAVTKAQFQAPQVPVIANASATQLASADAVRQELVSQVAQAVRWYESIGVMAAGGVSSYIEFGPGKILTGMLRRIVSDATSANVSGAADLQPASADKA